MYYTILKLKYTRCMYFYMHYNILELKYMQYTYAARNTTTYLNYLITLLHAGYFINLII